MMTTDDNTTELARALDSLDGYVTFGPRYWPGAEYFTLASLDERGETDGGGTEVCRDCVSSVARQAAALARGEAPYDPYAGARGLERIGNPEAWGGALVVTGHAVGYMLTGNESPYCFEYGGERGYCAECGTDLDGDYGLTDGD